MRMKLQASRTFPTKPKRPINSSQLSTRMLKFPTSSTQQILLSPLTFSLDHLQLAFMFKASTLVKLMRMRASKLLEILLENALLSFFGSSASKGFKSGGRKKWSENMMEEYFLLKASGENFEVTWRTSWHQSQTVEAWGTFPSSLLVKYLWKVQFPVAFLVNPESGDSLFVYLEARNRLERRDVDRMCHKLIWRENTMFEARVEFGNCSNCLNNSNNKMPTSEMRRN